MFNIFEAVIFYFSNLLHKALMLHILVIRRTRKGNSRVLHCLGDHPFMHGPDIVCEERSDSSTAMSLPQILNKIYYFCSSQSFGANSYFFLNEAQTQCMFKQLL